MSDTVTVTLVEHPLVADSLARIRDRDTPNALFRQNLERIGTLLLAEATRTLPTVDATVETPLTTAPARRLAVQRTRVRPVEDLPNETKCSTHPAPHCFAAIC